MTEKEKEEVVTKAMEKIGAKKLRTPDDVNERFVGHDYYQFDDEIVFPNSGNRMWLFSHNFAKAFWGKELIDTPYFHYNKSDEEGMTDYIPIKMVTWKWYLQQMILEEEPLKYLEKFLN